MAYTAKIIADSLSPTGVRLTTMELTYPRFVHAEFMTHRVFSRNAASSRAIPITKMLESIKNDPVIPVWWGKNQSGMQAREELTGEALELAKAQWLDARDNAMHMVKELQRLNVHKQIANRILEPWMWITVVATATDWSNFFALRCHPDAQPELQKIAFMARDLYQNGTPRYLGYSQWHLPYIDSGDWDAAMASEHGVSALVKMSVARCARVSYTKQDEKKLISDDIEMHDRLAHAGHWSPFEHVAKPLRPVREPYPDVGFSPDIEQRSGNLRGWEQYRKGFLNECL